MSEPNRLSITFKAIRQLGLSKTAMYAIYKLGLLSGHYRRITNCRDTSQPASSIKYQSLFDFPSPTSLIAILGEEGKMKLLLEADEIVAGYVRLFGAQPVPLQLAFDQPLQHWTAYEKDASLYELFYTGLKDVKYIWEPARFGWAFTLGRAWHLTRDERFAQAFWNYTEQFLDANLPCLGPHWVSAQEVAIRLMALVWSRQVFISSQHSTPERQARLAHSIVQHADRIPPTLVYARSQNNNHLLSEAAGLFTAGVALPDHPHSPHWRRLGWKWLQRGIRKQVDAYGEYAQHSSNYQRLMLQLALWIKPLARNNGFILSRRVMEALSIATHWSLSLLDPDSGCLPNLGANDGAYIFPLTICPFADHRPVLQAAARSFMGYQLPVGSWDELALWMGVPSSERYFQSPRYLGDSLVGKATWGTLRAVNYKNRPSHADQLHFDLWWRGLNIVRDAGSYLYNVDPPWDNALTHTAVHNTVSVDGCEQMTRAGRFLYLDWALAWLKHPIEADGSILQRQVAGHAGYRRLGVRHQRTVTVFNDEHWEVQDELLFIKAKHPARTFRLHWLLPDWDWQVVEAASNFELCLQSPHGLVKLLLSCDQPGAELSLVRAGELLYGRASVSPIDGWVSPTYGQKLPALSCSMQVTSQNDGKFSTLFNFPGP